MKQILSETQTTSDEYTAVGSSRDVTLILTGHAGGEWEFQIEAPDGTWVGTGVSFTANGVESGIVLARGQKYRLTGGTAGAKAWVSDFA